MWNPDVYLAFADHRGRPYFDLLARVGAEKPRRVVDLGCGPGNLTANVDAALARRHCRGLGQLTGDGGIARASEVSTRTSATFVRGRRKSIPMWW